MSVSVAHQVRASSEVALTEGAREARFRSTDLIVIHVLESLDNDIAEANRAGISDAVEKAMASAGLEDIRWDVRLIAGGGGISDVSEAILGAVRDLRPELL